MDQKKKNVIKEEHSTFVDYAKLPDDGIPYELANGVLQAMTPAPHPIHQLVSQELAYQLKQTCQHEYIIFVAPIDLILSDYEVRQPDLLMIHKDRTELVTNRGIEGAPDLIVEILSPSSIKRERMDKLHTYAKYQIKEYWLIDPIQKFMEQHILNKDRYVLNEVYMQNETIKSSHIPCAHFSMEDIFEEIPDLPNLK